MWNRKKVSVVFSTYNEKDSIKKTIEDCFATGIVDEVIAINNNAEKGTDEEIRKTKAKLFHEYNQGYGYGYQRALKESTGDIIIMTEPDGTFSAHDILKLLSYSDDFDVVLGTRTTSALITKGANMGLLLKWGNWAVAKMIELLFNTTHLSDVGCTMRLIKKKALKKIQSQFTVGGSHFGPDFLLLVITNKISFVEIPVHYNKRVGKSSVTGSFAKTLILGITVFFFVLKKWVLRVF